MPDSSIVERWFAGNWWWLLPSVGLAALIVFRVRRRGGDEPLGRRIVYAVVPPLDPKSEARRQFTWRTILIWVVAIILAGIYVAVEPTSTETPADVASFVERRRVCDHLRGEEAYDAQRRAHLARESEKYCRGTDAELAALRSRYRDSAAVTHILAPFETSIEAK